MKTSMHSECSHIPVVSAAVDGLEGALGMLVQESADDLPQSFVLREHGRVPAVALRREEAVVAPLEIAPALDERVELPLHEFDDLGFG